MDYNLGGVMIFSLDIPDESLEYIKSNIKHGSFVLNRWSDQDSKKCSNLVSLGIIQMMSYHGENMCYNPTYRLTDLGKKVMDQYLSKREESATQDI